MKIENLEKGDYAGLKNGGLFREINPNTHNPFCTHDKYFGKSYNEIYTKIDGEILFSHDEILEDSNNDCIKCHEN